MRFDEFAKEFMDAYTAENSPAELAQKEMALRNHLLPHFGGMELEEIKRRHIETYKTKKTRTEELAPKTVNNHLILLRRILGIALEEELIEKLPKIVKLKAPPSKDRILTQDELTAMLAVAPRQWRDMLIVAAHTGLRIGELMTLKWTDINWKAGTLTVYRTYCRVKKATKPPKGNRYRTLPMTVTVVQTLKGILRLGEWVFGKAPTGERYTYEGCRSALQAIIAEAGLRDPEPTWHSLRHTFASHLASQGVPLYKVMVYLGHQSMDMTERYAHLVPEAGESPVDILDVVLPSIPSNPS